MTPSLREYLEGLSDMKLSKTRADSVRLIEIHQHRKNDLRSSQMVESNRAMVVNITEILNERKEV